MGERDGLSPIVPEYSEFVAFPIPIRLKPYIRSWSGYSEKYKVAHRRRELPGPNVLLVIEFNHSLRLYKSQNDTAGARYPQGMVAGLGDSICWTEHADSEEGILVNFTPLGAWSFFGVAQHCLSRSVTDLSDLLPKGQHSLSDQLENTPSWEKRFQIVEKLLCRRFSDNHSPPSNISWAIHQIEQHGGLLPIEDLARDMGFSRKHLSSLFKEYVGFSPKLYANLVRFDRTIRGLQNQPEALWADLAFEFGYSDQAHLCREMKRFSELSPQAIQKLLR
jgi:AraC-like DNA-binding protein